MVLRKLGRHAAKALRSREKRKPKLRLPWRPLLEGLEDRWVPSTVLTVTNTNDSGTGSLRQAILDANSNPGQDTINFNIAGQGPQVINLDSALPAVTDPVVLDATSQPGYMNTPLIDLDGTHVNAGNGLTLSTGAGGSIIEGLDLSHFSGSGIEVDSGGNLIVGDYIGVDPSGTAAEGNGFEGIDITTGVGNTIGGTTAAARNVIVANRFDAIGITGGSADVIQGNYLGTDPFGGATLANGNNGIYVQNATDIIIGGAAPGAGNVISGNNNGVMLDTGASGVTISGNLIGTDASGSYALGNAGNGIFLNASNDNVIGGTAAGAGNVIAASAYNGIYMPNASGNLIQGNRIGTDAAGSYALANTDTGIFAPGASHNTIGGTAAGAGNLVSGNTQAGVTLDASGNFVYGNFIGTDKGGSAALANAVGVELTANNTVGGTAAGAGNVLSGNAGPGVQAVGVQTTAYIQGNLIGLGADGVTPLGNTYGIDLSTEVGPVVIGGTTAAARNVISANAAAGILADAAGTVIEGNYIGTDVTGTLARGNVGIGISIGGLNVVIGGLTATPGTGAGNVIAANGAGPRLGTGIDVTAAGAVIEGNIIGTDAAGTAALNDYQDSGVWVQASDVTVGGTVAGAGNLISGNVNGVQIEYSADDLVAGNWIGTDVTGTQALGNLGTGIDLFNSTAEVTIGGTTVAARNIISGNAVGGIHAGPGTADTLIEGNYLGTDVTGTHALGNIGPGIDIEGASFNTVGGTAAGAGNVISGNTTGIAIDGTQTTADSNLVAGNLIGTDVSGTRALGNTGSGIELAGANALFNQIGTGDASGRNVISGNATFGVEITAGAAYNVVAGNYVGTDVTGTAALGNAQAGVFLFGASSNTVGGTATGAGNVISGNLTGIAINGTQAAAASNLVAGNLIGTDASGTRALGNTGTGIEIAGAYASQNEIGTGDPSGRNVVSGNAVFGIELSDGAEENVVAGNYVGTDVTGTAALANMDSGIRVASANNTIGGMAPGAGNVLSGNAGNGLLLDGSGATGNLVAGNFLGTDFTGTLAVANANGIVVANGASSNTIGGTSATARNVLSGNTHFGIYLDGPGQYGAAARNVVEGNYVGTDVTGATALANGLGGVLIYGNDNTIGGADYGAGNVISGNAGAGVLVSGPGATGNLLENNYVGTDAAGTQALPNAGAGVRLGRGASHNAVGPGNVIAFNPYGVYVDAATGNPVRGNSIYANARGIAFSQGSPTGAPVLTSALLGDAGMTVSGTLAGAANAMFHLEFFASPDADAAGAQGEQSLGSADVTTDASGIARFQVTLPWVPSHQPITATATDAAGTTSAFSAAVLSDWPPSADAGPGQWVTEGDTVVFDGSYSYDADSDPLTYAWDFGDGATGTGAQPTHVYAEDGTYTVTLTVNDGLGGTDTSTATVTVGNAPPVFSLGGDRVLSDTRHLLTTGSFSDAGDTGWQAVVDYGDGSDSQPLAFGPDHVFTLDHTYAQDGSYTVAVTASDDAGVVGSASFSVSVFQQQEIGTSSTAVLAPGDTTATATTAGVSATATRPAGETGVLTVFVAEYTADPAVPVLTTTTDSQQVVSVFYDILAVGATPRDVVTARFDYPDAVTGTPDLQYLDAKTGRWEPVQGSSRQADSYVVDAANRTITVTFDDTSRPKVTNLLGTVFTVSVSTPVKTPAPISPPVTVVSADPVTSPVAPRTGPGDTTRAEVGDTTRTDTAPSAAVVSDTAAVASSPTRAATFQSTSQLTLTLTPSQDSQVRAARSSLSSTGPLGNASPTSSPAADAAPAASPASAASPAAPATGTPAPASATSGAAGQAGGAEAPADAADVPQNDAGPEPNKPTPGIKPAADHIRPRRKGNQDQGRQDASQPAPTRPQDEAAVEALMHELSEFLLKGAGLLGGSATSPPSSAAPAAPRTEHQSRLDAVDSIFGGHGPRRHGHRGEHARHGAPVQALGAALLGLAWNESRPRAKSEERKKGRQPAK